jgi:hypothetical protein
MNDIYGKQYLKEANKRYNLTLQFIKKHINQDSRILDIGVKSYLTELISKEGYNTISSPENIDYDLEFDFVKNDQVDVVTAFEILEHLVSPFPLLKNIKAPFLIASIPLKLWFAKAYWNENDPFDRHYHEFEPKQFDMLLNKAGWTIVDSQKWVYPINKIGIRPLLRFFYPRYYIVFAKKSES